MQIGHYLSDNCKKNVIHKVDKLKGIGVYVDADFASGWSSADANSDNRLSRTGLLFVMLTAFCFCYGATNFLTEIALLTAEAKYIAVSHALWDIIPTQNPFKEVSCIFLMVNPITDFLH